MKQQTKQAKKLESSNGGSMKQQNHREDTWHELHNSLQRLFRRSLQKGDVLCETTSTSPFMVTLTVSELAVYGQTQFMGTGETESDAKCNAAQGVLEALASQFEEAAAAHKAKKEEELAQKLQRRKEKMEENGEFFYNGELTETADIGEEKKENGGKKKKKKSGSKNK